jgi:hypothetical protein
MQTKFIVKNLETNEKEYFKTIGEIAEKYNMEYHQIREIYMNPTKKRTNPVIKRFLSKYKIIFNPDLLN